MHEGSKANSSGVKQRVREGRETLEAIRRLRDRLIDFVDPEEGIVGWRGDGEHDADRYYCEFCKRNAEYLKDIQHSDICSVSKSRAILTETAQYEVK